jgi:hypothetical protein
MLQTQWDIGVQHHRASSAWSTDEDNHISGSENNNLVQGLAMNTENYISWLHNPHYTSILYKIIIFIRGLSFTMFDLSRRKQEIEESIWKKQTMGRDILNCPSDFSITYETKIQTIHHWTTVVRLLECCWHLDPNLEFPQLSAYFNIGGIERLLHRKGWS